MSSIRKRLKLPIDLVQKHHKGSSRFAVKDQQSSVFVAYLRFQEPHLVVEHLPRQCCVSPFDFSHFDTLDQIASEAHLKPSSIARLAKAKRVLPSMIETLVFFWSLIAIRAATLNYSSDIVQIWKNQLVAGYYLASVARRCSDPEERKRLRELSISILQQAKARDGPLSTLSEKEVSYLDEQARLASELLQRSSSCVEGRNGQLSLRHHGLREISPRKLRVLGVLHNFVIKRSDGSTAANRFFGQKHRELFPWLLEHMPLPPRPRRKVQS